MVPSILPGNLLARDKVLTFGDDVARLDVVPILPGDETVQTVSKGDPKLPPYYYFSPAPHGGARVMVSAKSMGQFHVAGAQEKCRCRRDFLNVLIPCRESLPFCGIGDGRERSQVHGSEGHHFMLVASGGNDDVSPFHRTEVSLPWRVWIVDRFRATRCIMAFIFRSAMKNSSRLNSSASLGSLFFDTAR